jgi:tetratricopeptide (TPR) repeat protein
MARVEKTVFISYRRTNVPWALAVFQHLTHHGFDVFFEFMGIACGEFERVIIENIRSRAHFLVLLTPSALERCAEPGDWFRREIEEAMECHRNIVPMMLESFDFGAPGIASHLTGELALLKRYNGLSVPPEYFEAAMAKLRDKFLNVELNAVPHPRSETAQNAARVQQTAAATAPPVQEKELTAQEWFERGHSAIGFEEKLRCYGEAIRLKPDYAEAYCAPGTARSDDSDLDGALQDYDEVIRLTPGNTHAYTMRAFARTKKGDLDGALKDRNEVIRLEPDYAQAYTYRGVDRSKKGDVDGALKDHDVAIRLKPDYAFAYYSRGILRRDKGNLDGALADYDEAIRLKPEYGLAYYRRGVARRDKGDLDGANLDFAEERRLNALHKR